MSGSVGIALSGDLTRWQVSCHYGHMTTTTAAATGHRHSGTVDTACAACRAEWISWREAELREGVSAGSWATTVAIQEWDELVAANI
jgi:hypothetical protein